MRSFAPATFPDDAADCAAAPPVTSQAEPAAPAVSEVFRKSRRLRAMRVSRGRGMVTGG